LLFFRKNLARRSNLSPKTGLAIRATGFDGLNRYGGSLSVFFAELKVLDNSTSVAGPDSKEELSTLIFR
jgi:hypothetical protein